MSRWLKDMIILGPLPEAALPRDMCWSYMSDAEKDQAHARALHFRNWYRERSNTAFMRASILSATQIALLTGMAWMSTQKFNKALLIIGFQCAVVGLVLALCAAITKAELANKDVSIAVEVFDMTEQYVLRQCEFADKTRRRLYVRHLLLRIAYLLTIACVLMINIAVLMHL